MTSCHLPWPLTSPFVSWFFKKGNEYTSGIHAARILSGFRHKQPTWTLTYSPGHCITSLKEAKMYFNKTRCSVTFDLFLVDLKLPTSLTLTPVTAADRACPLPAADIYLHIDPREEFAVCQSMFWQICSICWSFILSVVFFFSSPFFFHP